MLSKEVEGVWGRIEIFPSNVVYNRPRTCRRSAVINSLNEVDGLLHQATAQLAVAENPLHRGAWIGSIKLCRDSVFNTDFSTNESNDQISLSIRLTDDARSQVALMTERRINRPIAIRVDGRVVASPMIFERIASDMIQVSGPDRATLQTLRTTAAAPC